VEVRHGLLHRRGAEVVHVGYVRVLHGRRRLLCVCVQCSTAQCSEYSSSLQAEVA
jgi:hypothetical protein